MPDLTPIVFVVDDDVSVRESLEALICNPQDGESRLSRPRANFCLARELAGPSCLVLDVTLPDLNGLDVQKRVAADRADMPIIFITGYGDVPMTVRAMKGGAAEFLTKPFGDDVLLTAIQSAIERSHAALDQESETLALREAYASLSRREREVMALGGLRAVEQAGRWRTWHQRDHREGASRQRDAENESPIAGRPGEYGDEAPPH